ncbi:unnamed protein product, partial [Prorocentrum cordatum]
LSLAHSTPLDRASGGVGVLCRRRIGFHPHADLVADGLQHRLQAAWLGAVMKGGLHLCSIWLFHSRGVSESNLHILAEAAALLGTLSGPWVIAGDWNITPDMLTATGWLDVVKGRIILPAFPTCNGSTYDFFVVSRSIAHAVLGVGRIDDGGFTPHFPTRLYLAGDARRKAVRRLVRPRRVDGELPAGPLLDPAPGDWEADDIADVAQLAAAIDNWHRAARRTFSSFSGLPAPWFRPRFRWEPAAGQLARRYAGASMVAVAWRECSARAFEVAAILGRPQPAAADEVLLARHWSRVLAATQRAGRAPGEVSEAMRAWAAAFGHARQSRGPTALRSLAAEAAKHAQRIERAVSGARLASYHGALAAPGGSRAARPWASAPGELAFRYVRGIGGWSRSPLGDPRCDEDIPDADDMDSEPHADRVEVSMDARSHAAVALLSEQSALDAEAAGWAEQWAVQEAYHEPFFPEHLLSAPQPITLRALDQAIASFPVRTGLGADRLSPRAIQRLPIAARMLLIHILLAAERLGAWTAACNLRAAWAAAFAAEASATSARQHVAPLLDLAKAFERVPRHLVAAAAARLGFDLIILRLSLAAYRLARAIGVEGSFSCLLIATLGLAAGSGFAALELQMLLHESMLIASWRWPSLRLYLCVDGLTITASDFSDEALVAVARGANFFVDMFERCLVLTVSTTKSFAVASRPSLAARLPRMSWRRFLVPRRSVKMLGTAYAGGRARAIGVLKTRLKQLKMRIPRVHALRRQRVDTARVVKAIGSPSCTAWTYIIGASSTHLHNMRVAALCAALPPGASRNVDVTFAVLDAGGAALDPAHAAHATPLRHWGLAYWQEWAPAPEFDHVFEESRTRLERVVATGRSPWSAVAGPVAAVIAAAWRLGWTGSSPRRFLEDVGETVDFLLMSPAMASAAVRGSVGRWRTKRVISMIPSIAASTPDLPTDAGADSFTALVGRPLARLLKGQGRPHSTVSQWSAPCRSMLLSAATGGQWPQVRLARLRHADVVDLACQLCGEAPGTLLHRRCRAASLPPEGWPEPPSACSDLLSALPEARATLLRARGLLTLRPPRPVAQEELAARWFPAPPDETRADLSWHADGSMRFGPLWELWRTGCGIVVVSGCGDLVAYGCAVPPPPAVALVLSITVAPPSIRTDCRAILTTAAAGTLQATRPTRMLAQLWSRVSALLDGDTSEPLVAGRLTWMPAHGSVASIGAARRSDGHVVTAVDWRANRLADAAAKAAAGSPPECAAGAQLFGQAECPVAHEGAILGAVTHAAFASWSGLAAPS